MNILILINSFKGLLTIRKEVVQSLLDLGHEVTISGPIDDTESVFKEMGCKLIDTPFNRKGTNPIMDMTQILRYLKIVREIKPDVVLTYTIKPNLYGGMACRLCGVPQIANVTGLGSAVENPGWLQKLTVLLYKVGLKKAYTVFFQNKANMDFCVQHKMVSEHTKLIPGSGVNLQYHGFQEYPSPNEPCKFIFISRLLREKGIEEYLAAAAMIKEKHPNTEFHILGTSEENYAPRVRKMEKDGIVFYHGRQADVRPFIGNAWCAIHPSFYPEGMSNVLLESCAAGRPIITTNRPGCGEIVDDGLNGYIVRQRDADDLAEKIERFLTLPYERKKEMGQAARKKVEKEFDRQIVVDAYLKEIESISNV